MAEAGIQRVSSETPAEAVSAGRTPKLLDRIRQVIRAKHYSRRTEGADVDWIRRDIVFHKKRHPSDMGAPEITAFLTWLGSNRHVSASTQNQALSAILFLYRDVLHLKIGAVEHVPRARMPIRVPVVLSRDEIARIMKQLDGPVWIVVALLYGAGLRLRECLELRIKDIDLERRQIVICRGKGQKDPLGCLVFLGAADDLGNVYRAGADANQRTNHQVEADGRICCFQLRDARLAGPKPLRQRRLREPPTFAKLANARR
jgi:integrase